MSRKVRIILGVLILVISLSLLVWGFLPARRETRIQPIPPAELQLPTPVAFRFDTASPLSAALPQPFIVS